MSGMSALKVAVVTGSNKGVGRSVVEKLCRHLGSGWDVFLTSRDESRGQSAVQELKAKGVNPKFHQLDVSSNESIKNLGEFLKKNYGGLDILVNNAAIGLTDSAPPVPEKGVTEKKVTEMLNSMTQLSLPFDKVVDLTMKTNFWGVVSTCDALFPLLRPHARVVHVSSTMSALALNEASPELQKRLTTEMNVEEVKQLMKEFEEAALQGKLKEVGWLDSPLIPYHASKVGVRLLAYAHAREMQADPREDIVVNCCCPGYVITDLTKQQGRLTPDEGADTPFYLATLEPNVSKDLIGHHFRERKVVPWVVGTEIVL